MNVEKEIQDLKQMLDILQRSIVQPGTVLSFAGAKSPNDEWLFCNGAAVSRIGYATLFKVIGETYGSGDGSTTFNLPDLRGRTAIGAGQSVGLSDRIIGKAIGEENHTLTIDEIPIHNHTGETSSEGSHNHTGGTAIAGSHNHTGITAVANPKKYRTVDCSGIEAHFGHEKGWGGCEVYVDRTDANFSNADHTHNFTTSGSGEHAHDFATSSAGEHAHDFATSNVESHIHVIAPNGDSQSHNIIQPSLVLNFIIKT